MRLNVNTKENGQKIVKKIREAIKSKKYGKFFSLGNIYEIGFGKEPVYETYQQGWPREELKKKMRLRQVKNGDWFIYVPDPIDLTFDGTMWCDDLPNIEKDDHFYTRTPAVEKNDEFEYMPHLSVRCCRVISKKKNTKVTELGYFHCWSHSRMPNSDGEILEQELGIVEFQDGSIRQIRPDHIIFGWEDK